MILRLSPRVLGGIVEIAFATGVFTRSTFMIRAWSRRTYWSDSKIARKILPQADKPDYRNGTSLDADDIVQNIRDYDVQLQEKYPIRYKIVYVYLDNIQDIIMFPIDFLLWARRYLSNRFVHKYHVLRTNLPKGQYIDLDHRMLHACFTGLEDFVEVECAWMEHIFNSDKYDGRRITFRRDYLKGIDYLLDHGKENGGEVYDRNLEILDLYFWWKFKRPARPEPFTEGNVENGFELEDQQEK